MTKRIKHVSELPKWFQLEKYEFTKKLDALGWFQQFYVRNTFLIHSREMKEEKVVFPYDFKQALQASRENPNTIVEKDPRLSNYCAMASDHPLKDFKPNNATPLKTFKSITMRDYISLKFLMQPERIRYIENWYSQPDNEKELYPEDAPWFNEPISNSFIPMFGNSVDTIKIDLRLPDSFLIDQFKDYLSEKRKSVSVFTTKHFRESDFNNWSNFGVLPYFDLIVWGIENEIKIPNRILADALYPNGDKGEETIRKTTNPLAKTLLEPESTYQLIIQALTEISEKNSP